MKQTGCCRSHWMSERNVDTGDITESRAVWLPPSRAETLGEEVLRAMTCLFSTTFDRAKSPGAPFFGKREQSGIRVLDALRFTDVPPAASSHMISS